MTSNVDSLLLNKYRSMLLLSNNINSISNNTIFQNDLSINNNLYVLDGININNNFTNNSNIYTSGLSNIQNNITLLNNLNSSTLSNLCNVSLGSNLLISNNTFLMNSIINSNLVITNNSVFNNNITLNSNLYISNTTKLNNVTMNSTLFANNLNINNSSTNSILYVSNNTIINNITICSNLSVSNTTTISGNTTILSWLNATNSFITNKMTELSNIEISGLSFINNDFNIASNATINSLIVNDTANFNNLNISGIVTTILPEYDSNINADIGGIPLWGFYRTGGILKIKLNTIAPTISLLGNTTISILIGSLYTDPGIIAKNYLNNIIIPYITNISYSGVNYLTTPIVINTGPTQIPTFNSLLSGNQIITYIAVDSNNNQSIITRTVNVTLDTHAPQITLNGSDIINLKVNNNYIEQGVNIKTYDAPTSIPIYNLISPNPTYLQIYKDFSILGTSNWTFEAYVYLTQYNRCMISDFRQFPYNGGEPYWGFNLEIDDVGNLGFETKQTSYISSSGNKVSLNTWNHIAYQKNNSYMEFYINGQFISKYNIGTAFDTPNIGSPLSSLFIGGPTNYPTSTSWHVYGSINQLTISTILRYSSTINFTPSRMLISDSTTIFFLGDNYIDNISNTKLSYNSPPPLTYFNNYITNTNIIPTINIYNSLTSLTSISSINTSIPGKYLLTYSATDISNNISNIVYRTVYVLNTNTIESYDITNSYLYLDNNYNILTSSLFWTIEGWFNITSLLNNGCTIIDFREKPFTSNTGKLAFLINSSGYLGMYLESTFTFTSITVISLNVWNHIAIQKNGIYFEFYINGTFAGQILFNGTLLNFNQLTLGMKNDLTNTDSNYHFKGSISQIKITNSLVYSKCFVPLDDLTPISNTDILFFLGNNLTDIITNTVLTYNTIPITGTKEYFLTLPIANLEFRNLVFNLQCSNLIVSNVSTNSMTWNDSSLNNYQFICHPNANTINSLIKVQNNNGWKRTGNIGWTMSTASNTSFKSLDWINGLTLEQWIYIDYDYIPSTTRMLLVGQSSMFSTYDYGFCFTKEYYPFNTFPYNILSFATSTAVISQGNGAGAINLQSLKGKWSHLCVTISNINNLTKELKLYINGALLIFLDSTTWSSWCDPYSSPNKFTIGCNSNNGTIQVESLGKVHFGNTRMYNRILNKYEIFNNYNYEKSLYNINLNGITYSLPISWTMSGGTSTIYTNFNEQTINIETNKYIYYNNYTVQSNTVYNINFMAMLLTATNLCIVITNNSGTFNTVNGYQFTPTNSGINTNKYINLNFIFETKSLTSINIYIGYHNQSDIGSQSLGTFKIVNFNINKYNLFNNTVLPDIILTPIDWVRPDGVSTSIITNNNYQTLYLDNLKYYTILTLTPNTAYNISFLILLGTSSNFCISLRNGLAGSWNIGGYEFTPIKNGLNSNTYTLVSYVFDSKSYTQLILYVGYHFYIQQTTGTVTIANFTISPIVSNFNYISYNPTSDVNFISSIPSTIPLNTITNYDFTTGWLNQTIDYNILRMVPSWTMEVWCYATSWLNSGSNDNNYIFEFSSGTAYFSLGVTSNITNITPTITSDGMGRPFIYYSGDTVSQWKIKSGLTVPLNQWNHIVYQKNSNTQLEMFVNGVSVGTFTISFNDWIFPIFMGSVGLNNIVLGANISNPSSTTNHWKGKLSQPKITIGNIYTTPFTPQFDLSINNYGLFLLQDNFYNNVIGKTMINNNSVIIPTYSIPVINIIGSNNITLYANIDTYTDLGTNLLYYQRTLNIIQNINGDVNTSIVGSYSIIYTAIDSLSNIGYAKKLINVIKYNIPPVITLIGLSTNKIQINNVYTELGVTITTNLNQIIIPVITGSVNTSLAGQYVITYSATDSFGNSAQISRIIIVFDLPINGISLWLDPSDASTITTQVVNTFNIINSITDKSGNNIIFNNTPVVNNNNSLNNSIISGNITIRNNTINNLNTLYFATGNLKSANSYPNSYNVTLAMILTPMQIPNENKYQGLFWSHCPDVNETPKTTNSQRRWPEDQISLMFNYNKNQSINAIQPNYYTSNMTWITNHDTRQINMPYYYNTPMMYIGVLVNGTFRYYKMINLNTGQEYSTSGYNSLSMVLINGYIWLNGYSTYPYGSSCYIGEVMHWNRVLSNTEIYTVQNYLFNKWGNKNITVQYTSLIPNLTLNGVSTYYLTPGSSYNELGITITNTIENLIPNITGQYDLNTVGNYTLTYTVTDSYGTSSSINRNIIITSTIPYISYDVRNCSFNCTNLNLNSLNNNNWTIECWLNIYIEQSRSTDAKIVIFDFRPYSASGIGISSQINCMYMTLDLYEGSYKPILNIVIPGRGDIVQSFTFNNYKIPVFNSWNHYAWMCYNNKLYVSVNGVCSNPFDLVSNGYLSYFNNFTQLFQMHIGNYISDSILNYYEIFTGIKISQPLIQLGTKYNILGFLPVWNLTPSDYTNVLFWQQNAIETISSKPMIKISVNKTVFIYDDYYISLYRDIKESIIDNIPIVPIMTLKGKINNNYIKINTTYTDYGVSVKYILNPTIIPYITSIIDNNGIEYITTPLNALNNNIISNINTSILNTSYTITYTITTNIITTFNRIIYIVSDTLPSTYYTTSKLNVIASSMYPGGTNMYYYINNSIIYTSTDFVCFSNGSNIIYYMDNNKIVSSNVVITDSNGVMWVTVGLMKMQVYNPMNYSINYNGNSYSLYIDNTILLNSNGIYKNNNGSNFVYQYNNNWYYSTDMITFYQIIFDSNNSIVISVNSSSPIYFYNNMVLTTTPPIQIINNKNYWKFGIVCVNSTNLSDCCLYYNNTVYYQQTPTNSYAPGINLSRYTPTYISSGSLFSSPNNTILFYIGLGFIIVTMPNSAANFIYNDGTLDKVNIYNNLQNSYGLAYSSNSGYFMTQTFSQPSNTISPKFNTRNNNVAQNTTVNNMLYPPAHILTDGTYNIIINSSKDISVIYNINDGSSYAFAIGSISFKPTGSGTLQYVITSNVPYDRHAIKHPYWYGYGYNNFPIGYITFETKSYLTLSPFAFNWDDDNKQFNNLYFNLTITNLNFNYCINPACLEPFVFNKLNAPTYKNDQIPILNNQSTAISIPASNLNTVAFTLNHYVGGANVFGVAAPATRFMIWMYAGSNPSELQFITAGITQYNSDFCYNGNILNVLSNYYNYDWGKLP